MEFKYLGKIDYDDNVESYIVEGKSLLELPLSSPAYVSIKKIMEKIMWTPFIYWSLSNKINNKIYNSVIELIY